MKNFMKFMNIVAMLVFTLIIASSWGVAMELQKVTGESTVFLRNFYLLGGLASLVAIVYNHTD